MLREWIRRAGMAIGPAVLVVVAVAYGAYAMTGSGDNAPGAGQRTADKAAMPLRCEAATPAVAGCATPSAEAELTCEQARACATPTVEPELTCEEAHACATPETECLGEVCFTPPVPPLAACPPDANCTAPETGGYACVRAPAGGIDCRIPGVIAVPPCGVEAPIEGHTRRSIAPACPPVCELPMPIQGNDARPHLAPACPLPCAPLPAEPSSGSATKQSFACTTPCAGAPTIAPDTEPPAPIPACPAPCGDPAHGFLPSCPPLPPDCSISSDGAVACPGATPGSGAGSAPSGVATAVPGTIAPDLRD